MLHIFIEIVFLIPFFIFVIILILIIFILLSRSVCLLLKDSPDHIDSHNSIYFLVHNQLAIIYGVRVLAFYFGVWKLSEQDDVGHQVLLEHTPVELVFNYMILSYEY